EAGAEDDQARERGRRGGGGPQDREADRRDGKGSGQQVVRGVAAGEGAAGRASGEGNGGVAAHQRHRGGGGGGRRVFGVHRAPAGHAPLGRGGAEDHRGGDPERGRKRAAEFLRRRGCFQRLVA